MKKIISFLLIFALWLAAVFSLTALAAGPCAIAHNQESPKVYEVVWTCTGDSSSGAILSTAGPYINGWVFLVITSPGSPAPTGGYGLTLTDGYGIDIAAGNLASRSSTSPQQQKIAGRYINGTLTLAATGQSAASAVFTVRVKYYRE